MTRTSDVEFVKVDGTEIPRCIYCKKNYKFIGVLYVPMCECKEWKEAGYSV